MDRSQSAAEQDVDVFGLQLYDQHRGLIEGEFREVGERDDGKFTVYDHPKWYFTPEKEWASHLRKAMKLARGRILDVGCGAGRVGVHLQSLGYEVVGIDHSPLAVQICRERGLFDARLLSLDEVSVHDLGVFDTIVMAGNNFGLLENSNKARRVLKKLHRMTSDEGLILAETTDPYTSDDLADRLYQQKNRSVGRMGGQYRHRELYRVQKGRWFDWLFVSRDEMRQLVEGTGWELQATIDPEGDQYVGVLAKKCVSR